MADLAEVVPADSKSKVLFNVILLFFSVKSECKLTAKVECIQLIESGTDAAEVAKYTFYTSIHV